MKWDKAKTILIVFFVVINLVLLIYLIADNMHSAKIEGQVADTVVDLLDENGIRINKNAITDAAKQKKMKTVYVKNIISSYDEFANTVLGEDVIRGEENRYTSKNGSLSFKGDYFVAEASNGGFLQKFQSTSGDENKKAEEYLVSLGAEIKDSQGEYLKDNSVTKVHFEEIIDGFNVYGAELTVELTNEGVKKVYGCWYNEQEGGDSVMELKSPSGALIEYMNGRKSTSSVTIENISLGYASLETMLYHESVLLTPVWEIAESGGEKTYINAREN